MNLGRRQRNGDLPRQRARFQNHTTAKGAIASAAIMRGLPEHLASREAFGLRQIAGARDRRGLSGSPSHEAIARLPSDREADSPDDRSISIRRPARAELTFGVR